MKILSCDASQNFSSSASQARHKGTFTTNLGPSVPRPLNPRLSTETQRRNTTGTLNADHRPPSSQPSTVGRPLRHARKLPPDERRRRRRRPSFVRRRLKPARER